MEEGTTLAVPAKGVPPRGWLSMTDAVTHTGVSVNTLRRRVDAWLERDGKKIGSGYAVKGGRGWGGRLVDEVDAERVRLQHLLVLPTTVTVEQWAARVRAGDLPAGVTSEPWWQEAVRRLRAGETPESP